METLVKNMRVRFSGLGQDSEAAPTYIKERKLPPQKTQSFKGGKKAQNWLRRQFSGEMSQESDLSGKSEFATAIAAAAAAIHSIDESLAPRKLSDSLIKSPSKKEDITIGRVSRRFSDQEVNGDQKTPGEASMKKPQVADQIMAENWTNNQKTPKKAPSIKKTATFAGDNLNDISSKKSGTAVDTRTRPTVYEIFPTAASGKQEKPTASGAGKTKADAWEKAEMERIRKRHERVTSTILSWENEKKAKAKRRMDRIESEIERRRARASQRYRNDMSKIDQIAGGARAVAEERRKDDESKIKERAQKIRTTGKVPCSCFCF